MIKTTTALVTALIAMVPASALSQQIPAIQGGQYNGFPSDGSIPAEASGTPTEQDNAAAAAAAAAAEVPRTMPPAVAVLSPDKPMNKKAAKAVNVASKWKAKSAIPTLDEFGVVRFVHGAGQPTVVCAPLFPCNLALEEGEVITKQPHIGDSSRWIISYELSGYGPDAVTNVIIKPKDAGLDTLLLIHTKRPNSNKGRVYSILLSSRQKDYMPLVAFDYPDQETDKSWQKYANQVSNINTQQAATPTSVCDQVPSIPPSAFRISESDFPWKPVQVYAVSTPVGNKMCVQFPADIGSIRLPGIAALEKDGGWFSGPTTQMVDASFQGGRYIVDEMVDRLLLFRGVGSNQESITVERKK